MQLRNAMLSSILLGASALAGCGGGYGYSYRAAYVPPPPPAPVVGAVGYAPGPGLVWAEGFWDLRGGQWYWAGGQWVRPPRHRAIWVSPYWEPHRRGYKFHRGYWR